MQITTYNLTGRKPAANEYSTLTSLKFEKKPISSLERNSKLTTGFMALGGAIFCLVLGGVMFVMSRAAGGNGSGIISMMGIGIAVLGTPVLLIWSINSFVSIGTDPRSKTPQDAVSSYVSRVLVGDDTPSFDHKNVEYAYSVLQRKLPDQRSVEHDALVLYLRNIRADIQSEIKKHFTELIACTHYRLFNN